MHEWKSEKKKGGFARVSFQFFSCCVCVCVRAHAYARLQVRACVCAGRMRVAAPPPRVVSPRKMEEASEKAKRGLKKKERERDVNRQVVCDGSID